MSGVDGVVSGVDGFVSGVDDFVSGVVSPGCTLSSWTADPQGC